MITISCNLISSPVIKMPVNIAVVDSRIRIRRIYIVECTFHTIAAVSCLPIAVAVIGGCTIILVAIDHLVYIRFCLSDLIHLADGQSICNFRPGGSAIGCVINTTVIAGIKPVV